MFWKSCLFHCRKAWIEKYRTQYSIVTMITMLTDNHTGAIKVLFLIFPVVVVERFLEITGVLFVSQLQINMLSLSLAA